MRVRRHRATAGPTAAGVRRVRCTTSPAVETAAFTCRRATRKAYGTHLTADKTPPRAPLGRPSSAAAKRAERSSRRARRPAHGPSENVCTPRARSGKWTQPFRLAERRREPICHRWGRPVEALLGLHRSGGLRAREQRCDDLWQLRHAIARLHQFLRVGCLGRLSGRRGMRCRSERNGGLPDHPSHHRARAQVAHL
jgi:hypothetical protein